MKRIILSALLILAITSASFATRVIAKGNSFTPQGSFTIEVADKPMVLNNVTLDTYVVTYETGYSFTIAVEKEKKCRKYIVVSDGLSVQYVCNDNYFGIEKLDGKYEGSAIVTGYDSMNWNSYYHQRVLGSGTNTTVDCMKLIGAYFPDLLKSKTEA
jgi:hypothetical protein